MRVPSEDKDTACPDLSSFTSPSMSPPICDQLAEDAGGGGGGEFLMGKSKMRMAPSFDPMASTPCIPKANREPSDEMDTDLPAKSFAESPSMLSVTSTQPDPAS